jgi:hypothetical protein
LFYLVIIYGKKNIDYAGEQVLGYPGTWATEKKETEKIKQYLIKKGV